VKTLKLSYPKTSHKECAYFRDGFCILNNIPVEPDQPACPNFTPRGITPSPKPAPTYQQTWQQDTVGFRGAGRGLGMGRGMGIGRGGGRGMGMGREIEYVTPQTFHQAPTDTLTAQVPPISRRQEIQMLENHMGSLQQQLGQIKKRIQELG
jgi:hypothetical protein